jgi:hypothetical protein
MLSANESDTLRRGLLWQSGNRWKHEDCCGAGLLQGESDIDETADFVKAGIRKADENIAVVKIPVPDNFYSMRWMRGSAVLTCVLAAAQQRMREPA